MRRFLALAALLALAACATPTGSPDTPGEPDATPDFAVTAGAVAFMDTLRLDDEALRFRVRVAYPVLEGVAADVNAAIRDSVAAFAETFRPTEPPEPGDDPFRSTTTVEGGTHVEWARPDLFSAVVEVYVFAGGAHGTGAFYALNLDPRTGAWLALGDVIADGPDARAVLAEAVTAAAVARRAEQGGETAAEARAATDDYTGGGLRFERAPLFTLVPDSLVLHIPPYEVGPYVLGAFRVPVPLADLGGRVRPDGPAPRTR
jgi:hypothetical protein